MSTGVKVDVDLLLADLRVLQLDPRTERCLMEALESYRRGLYLAAASLLGAASEGTWYTAAERLRDSHPELGPMLDNDRTAQMQKKVADIVRIGAPRMAWRIDDILMQAQLLRSLRNYGVHPREAIDPDSESMFTESWCGTLIMNAWN